MEVAFDESGNTGQDLLNKAQPVFVLASCYLKNKERNKLDKIFSTKADEIKFTTLRRSSSGRNQVIDFLSHPLVNEKKFKTSVYHKKYMVVTKVVDLLIENVAYRHGIDLYEKGANLAMSNVMFLTFPPFIGSTSFNTFLENFVTLIREKDKSSVSKFYSHCELLFNSANQQLKGIIGTILKSKEIIEDILEQIDLVALDPAIPSFIAHCDFWGKELKTRFDVIHDNSKPLKQHKKILEALMNEKVETKVVGYDRRKSTYPLKVNNFNLKDSKSAKLLQFSDVLSGTFNYWLKGKIDDSKQDEFWKRVDSNLNEDLIINNVWPSQAVTPQELGTDQGTSEETSGIDYIDQMIKENQEKST